jgi:hypothetical protein
MAADRRILPSGPPVGKPQRHRAIGSTYRGPNPYLELPRGTIRDDLIYYPLPTWLSLGRTPGTIATRAKNRLSGTLFRSDRRLAA